MSKFMKQGQHLQMKTVIVCSLNDPAGTNIRERLLENYPFEESEMLFDGTPVYSLDPEIYLASSVKDIVFVNNLDEQIRADRAVFISRHYANSGIPSLTAHFTGNFGQADFGGNPREISRYSPNLLKRYMLNLSTYAGEFRPAYNLTLEATHHGPTSLKPSVLFVELGSSVIQWKDMSPATKISEALMATLRASAGNWKCAVCVGGTHYSEKFNDCILNSDLALGPIIPKYALEFFTAEILKQILEKGDQPTQAAVVDKKGLGKHKENVLRTLEGFNLEKIFV